MNKSLDEFGITHFPPLENPQLYLSIMFESAKKHHPNGRFVFITNETTKIQLPEYIETVRISSGDQLIESARFTHMMSVLDLAASDSNIIVLDSDMIVMGNLDSIFSQPGDLFFTYQKESRKHKVLAPNRGLPFPVNLGFVGIGSKNKARAFKTFKKLIAHSLELEQQHLSYWFGLQGILLHIFEEPLLKCEKMGYSEPYLMMYDDTLFSFINAEVYNYPANRYMQFPLDAKVIHFKGRNNKKRMLEYWQIVK